MDHSPTNLATTSTCAGSPVSWQVAFWSLVPAALNTMTQPSGRVCGLSAQFRTYLRISPVYCSLDTVVLLFRLVLYRTNGLPWRLAAREVKNARFDEEEEEVQTADGGFQALENLTFVRLLLFTLGTMPQAIKLAALENVPWTKAWGWSLVVSFVVLEVVFGMVPAEEQTSGSTSESQTMVAVEEHTVGAATESQAMRILDSLVRFNDSPLGKVRGMKRNLAVVDGIAAVLATFFHCVVLVWTLHQLWHPGFDFTGSIFAESFSWRALLILPVLGLYVGVLASGSIFILVLPMAIIFTLLKELPPLLAVILTIPTVFGGLLLVLTAARYGVLLLGYSGAETITGWFYEIIALFFVLNLLCRVCWEVFASQPLRMKLGLLAGQRTYLPPPRQYELKDEDNEIIAVGAFLGFVATLVLCVVWYQVRFDPVGTCKPVWTDVFG